jgi:lipid A 4'-phosphatase
VALAHSSRWQRPARESEAICLVAIALVTAVVFASGSVDIAVASWFYRPDAADHWPLARQFPWPLLYRAATWITALLVILGLAALAASFAPERSGWRRPAVLVLLAVIIGPGLLGNAVFKDHWEHPRPRDIIEFGGPLHYTPSPLIGREGGASFPCGHCTVGFIYGAGWWIWRRRRPGWAAASLTVGLLLGFLLGAGRMAAGAHFLSDIVWSGWLAFGVTHLLFYHVPRISATGARPEPAASRAQPRWRRAYTIVALLGGAVVLLGLFVTPHGTQLTASVPLSPGSPRILEVEGDTANVVIVLIDAPVSQLTIEGELHGFGLPTSRLAARLEVVSQPLPRRLRYRIETQGWLTDLDGFAKLSVPASAFERVIVDVQRGDIRVSDTTRIGVLREKRVQLKLHTGRGEVQVSSTGRASA